MSTQTEQMLEVDEPLGPAGILPTREYVIPRANLLPPELKERAALRKLQAGMAVAVLVCGGVIGGLYYTTANGRAPAHAELAQAQAESTALSGQARALAPSQVAHAKVLAAKKSLETAMGAEVLWSTQLDALRRALPAGVRLSTLTVNETDGTPSSSATSVTLPSAPGGTSGATSSTSTTGTTATGTDASIATVSMSGVAISNDAVADWLDQLAGLSGWSNVYLSNTASNTSSSGATLVTYSITANITAKALSHRYTNGNS